MRKFQYNESGVEHCCDNNTFKDKDGDSRILVVTDCKGETVEFFKSGLSVCKSGNNSCSDLADDYSRSIASETHYVILRGVTSACDPKEKVHTIVCDGEESKDDLYDTILAAIKYDSERLNSPQYATTAAARLDANLPIGATYFVTSGSDSLYVKRVQTS